MWKVVITEIQDANTLDPIHAPPGAFFVSTRSASLGRSTASICQTSSALSIVCNPRRADTHAKILCRVKGFHAGTQTSPELHDLRETRAATARQQTSGELVNRFPNRFMIFNNLRKHSLNQRRTDSLQGLSSTRHRQTSPHLSEHYARRNRGRSLAGGRVKYLDVTTSSF